MMKKATGLYDARIKAMLRAQKRKNPPSVVKEQKQLLDAELAYAQAQHQHTHAQLLASENSFCFVLHGPSIERAKFSDDVAISNFQSCILAGVFFILWLLS